MNIINIEHISKIFGGKVIFDDVSCGISEGEKIGVIGINGTGKTTLLRVLAGLEQPDEGQVITQNGIRIAYLQQNPAFPEEKTVLSYVTDGMWDMDWTLQSEAKSMLNQLGILVNDGDTVIHGKMPRQCQPHLSGTHDDDSHILTSFNFLTGCPPAF